MADQSPLPIVFGQPPRASTAVLRHEQDTVVLGGLCLLIGGPADGQRVEVPPGSFTLYVTKIDGRQTVYRREAVQTENKRHDYFVHAELSHDAALELLLEHYAPTRIRIDG